MATTTQYRWTLISASLEIMKNPSDFNRENGCKLGKTPQITLRRRRRNYNTETDADQLTVTFTNKHSEKEIRYTEEQETTQSLETF